MQLLKCELRLSVINKDTRILSRAFQSLEQLSENQYRRSKYNLSVTSYEKYDGLVDTFHIICDSSVFQR